MASLQVRLQDLATRIATEIKSVRALVNGNAADLAALSFGAKTTVVGALNELKGMIDGASAAAGATINDAASSSTTQTYSVDKIRDLVTTSISALTAGAPGALDTLDELAAALGDDANFAANITTALSNRLRVDTAAQGLTEQQKTNGRANLGVPATTEIGNPDANLVSVFETGLS
ncbi:hypothetical protein [Brevundimonas vesicularis]|uniref:Phage tail protein n=1 Tax=Brevundimonas vesicularis TaxID=41276 RepID=A0A1Z3U7A5_BREVE|nr:hypothetical protein [Brevundimonas vesicularis]ASE39151.1 hypothetical protein CEP68_06340 [Brevundimonas vesicularis]